MRAENALVLCGELGVPLLIMSAALRAKHGSSNTSIIVSVGGTGLCASKSDAEPPMAPTTAAVETSITVRISIACSFLNVTCYFRGGTAPLNIRSIPCVAPPPMERSCPSA